MLTTLNAELLRPLATRLGEANQAFMKRYPGDRGVRQPVHTLYGGAHLYTADAVPKLGAIAQQLLLHFAPDCITFARAVGLSGAKARLSAGTLVRHGLQRRWGQEGGARTA